MKENYMRKKNMLLTGLAFVLFLAGACCPTNYQLQKNELQKHWGRSFESAKYNQIITPVPENKEPVLGLDGQAATTIIEEYKKSFKAEYQETEPSRLGVLNTFMK
jgi:hypothetical protein